MEPGEPAPSPSAGREGPGAADVREEGEDGAGRARAVAVVEVVGAGVVEVDRALHQPQAERAGVEIQVALRVGGDGRDVVDAADRDSAVVAHATPPYTRAANA